MTFYITTAIDYPNSKPHMGHAYEKIVADAFARWNRLKGEDVFFSTGTDEHGQKIYEAATKRDVLPQKFVDGLLPFFKGLFSELDISYDRFIRTTDADHEALVKELIRKASDSGDVYKGVYKGFYSIKEEAFLTEKELPPRDSVQWKAEIEEREEETYFFKLSKYQDQIIDYVKNTSFVFPKTRRNEILERLKEPLRDLSISRLKKNMPWGIDFPLDSDHVVYVWFDALPNYLSSPRELLSSYWPASMHVIGKDIIWFHAVIWPAILLSTNYPLPKNLLVHGFINDAQGQKMSKSRGNGIDPMQVITAYGSEALRYYLLRSVPSGEDGNFSEEDLIARYNGELANELGNLVNRAQKLVHTHFGGALSTQPQDLPLIEFSKLDALMSQFLYHRVLEELISQLHIVNAYVNEKAPWKNEDTREKVLYNVLEQIRVLTHYFAPFIPEACEKIGKQLGFSLVNFDELSFGLVSYQLNEGEIIFPKLELLSSFLLDLRVGKITDVSPVKGADKLYVEQVDLGNEKRQIVSGIAPYYTPEELIGKKIIVVCNLKPIKLRGVESSGMLLAYTLDDQTRVVEPLGEVGDSIGVKDLRSSSLVISIDQFLAEELKVKEGVLTAKSGTLLLNENPILIDAPDGSKIR